MQKEQVVQGGGEEKQIENFTETRSQWVVRLFSISGGFGFGIEKVR